MDHAFDLSTDVAAAGSALAGLLLVYIGGVSSAFGSFRSEDQSTVIGAFLRRAWLGFGGFILALTSSASALSAKWLQSVCLEHSSLILIFMAFVAAAATALWTVLDIK